MEKDLNDKISLYFRICPNRFSPLYTGNDGDYKVYDKKMLIVQDQDLNFLKQFEKVSFRTFIRKDYFDKHYENYNYYSSNLIIITDDRVNIHDGFSKVLFLFIINELKDDIQIFLDWLTDDRFKSKMKSDYKEDEYELQFGLDSRFFDFMYDNVSSFNFIRNLLKGSKNIYINENRMFIKIRSIIDLLKENDTVYNFLDYKIV